MSTFSEKSTPLIQVAGIATSQNRAVDMVDMVDTNRAGDMVDMVDIITGG